MIKLIKNLSLLIVSFFISFELLSSFSINSNKLIVKENKPLTLTKNYEETIYFIGDSYAKTNYVDEGYPIIFREHFKSNGLNFVDLSKNGSELDKHRKLLDSISRFNPKLIIYYYNIGDVISLEQSAPNEISKSPILTNKSKSLVTSKNKNNYLSNLALESSSIGLIKDGIQYLYLTFTDEYSPSSYTYKFPFWNKKHKKEIQKLFNSIKAENIIILITTPFNSGDKPKNWEQYKLFKEMELNSNVFLIQSVDIVDDPKLAVSWRNGHPNQKAIKLISDSIIQLYSNLKD